MCLSEWYSKCIGRTHGLAPTVDSLFMLLAMASLFVFRSKTIIYICIAMPELSLYLRNELILKKMFSFYYRILCNL